MLEKRVKPRKDYNTTIEYVLDSSTGPDQKLVLQKGVTKNVSDSGFCMYTTNPIREGQNLKIPKNFLFRDQRSAKVRWAKRVIDNFYLAGLMFT